MKDIIDNERLLAAPEKNIHDGNILICDIISLSGEKEYVDISCLRLRARPLIWKIRPPFLNF